MPSGQRVPSVSSIINVVFPFEGQELAVERAAQFGTALHKAIELTIKRTLDPSTVDEALNPYLDQFWKFISSEDILTTQCKTEVKLYSKKFKFAGMIDLVEKNIYDFKSGQPHPKHHLQIAAYRHLWNINNPKNKKKSGIVVYLDGSDKNPAMVAEKPSDFNAFLSCLEIYNFKKGNNL